MKDLNLSLNRPTGNRSGCRGTFDFPGAEAMPRLRGQVTESYFTFSEAPKLSTISHALGEFYI
jgi:hypothetical protein